MPGLLSKEVNDQINDLNYVIRLIEEPMQRELGPCCFHSTRNGDDETEVSEKKMGDQMVNRVLVTMLAALLVVVMVWCLTTLV